MASAATEKPNAQVVQDIHTPNFRGYVIFHARDYSRLAASSAPAGETLSRSGSSNLVKS
jgi:hypothetical protein